MKYWLILPLFTSCLANTAVDVGILYTVDDELVDIAIRHVDVRFKPLSSFEMRNEQINTKFMDTFAISQSVCSMIEKGIYAIIGPTTAKGNVFVQSISENFELPQLQIFWNPTLDTLGNRSQIVNMYPEPRLFSQALSTLVKAMSWKSYTIVYENDESLVRLQEVLKIQRVDADHYPIIIRRLLPGRDQSSLLKEIKTKAQSLHIILDCHVDRIMDILQQASKISMLGEYNSYILTSLDAHTLDFTQLTDNEANITTLRMIATNKASVRNVIRDWEFMEDQFGRPIKIDPESIKLSTALLYDGLLSFMTIFEQLSLTRVLDANPLSCDGRELSAYGLAIAEYLKLKPISNTTIGETLTGSIEFDKFGRRKNFKFQIIEYYERSFRQSGEWSSDNPNYIHYMITSKDNQLIIAKKMHKKVFRVASRTGPPYLMLKTAENGTELVGNDRYEGYVLDLIDGIAEVLNFSYEFYLTEDNNYGSYDPVKQEWNGLIRDLLDRKADLAVCDLTITYERGAAVDFSTPFMTLGISILYSKAAKKAPDLLSFMQPLSLDIWLYMATAYLVLSIVFYFTARLAPRDWESPHPCDDNPTELENIWTIKNCFWLTLGSIMTQGCDILPKGLSTRTIVGMWWFFSLIIASSYTANLAAFLTNERMGPTIESAEDLAKQSDIKYGCVLGGATSTFFRDSNFSTYQRMWRTMETAEPSVFQKSNKDGVKSVKTRKRMYAFLMESSSIEYERERDCELSQVGGWLDTKGYGIAMPVNSPYRTKISAAVLKMQEEGKLRKLKEKWWKQMHGGGKCNESEETTDDSAAELGIDHVGGVFVVLTVGVILAFLISIAEFLWNVRKISVQGQMSPKEAFVKELRFALSVSDRKQTVVKKGSPSREVET